MRDIFFNFGSGLVQEFFFVTPNGLTVCREKCEKETREKIPAILNGSCNSSQKLQRNLSNTHIEVGCGKIKELVEPFSECNVFASFHSYSCKAM